MKMMIKYSDILSEQYDVLLTILEEIFVCCLRIKIYQGCMGEIFWTLCNKYFSTLQMTCLTIH